MRVPVVPHPQQHLVLSVIWILAILIDVYWCLVVFLICNSLTTYDVEYIFIQLFAICKSSVRCPFRPFLKNWVVFLLLSFRVLCIFWIQVFCQIGVLQRFYPTLWTVFSLHRAEVFKFKQWLTYKCPVFPASFL